MFKSKTKYTWEGWDSSGREDWVSSVKHPCELIGVHAKLIDKELKESEKIEYCIYAPRVSSTSTPFGFKSEESSCGFCATDKRFIVTKNRHIKEVAPYFTSIDFTDILYFNIGSDLLLSWIAITYLQSNKLKQATVLFSSNGRHHFEKAMRSYKKYCYVTDMDRFKLATLSASGFIHKISNSIHRSRLKTLISANERCALTSVVGGATSLITGKALLIARNSRVFSIGNSVDVLNIPLDKINSPFISEEAAKDENIKFILNNVRLVLNNTDKKEGYR